MAAAPVGVMFMMLGLFLLLEIKAERVGDPDSLSTRVRSEVYALPPLPTARSIRKLSVSDADDQIEQFIQRLDHVRFAVCGTPAELGKGRCVLITSAIGGEGKTTLAAQLAARCGNAGMSTLLIDSDFRRASLCPLARCPRRAWTLRRAQGRSDRRRRDHSRSGGDFLPAASRHADSGHEPTAPGAEIWSTDGPAPQTCTT